MVAIRRRIQRVHVDKAYHLPFEVHMPAGASRHVCRAPKTPRFLALDLHKRVTEGLNHLVFKARDDLKIVRVGERTAARHKLCIIHADIREVA